jgi:ribose transport system substrate-binding protein
MSRNASRFRAALALAATSVLALSACASATSASSGSQESAAAPVTGAAAECVAQAKTDVDAKRQALDLVVPTGSIDVGALKGKSLWFITVTMNQFSTDMASGIEEAADAAGLTTVLYDGQGSANRFTEGMNQAIAQDAGGIVLVGIEPSLISAELSAAKAAGIPVLNTLNSNPTDPVPDGMFANFTADFTADGRTAAEWALNDSGCATDMIIVKSSTVPVWNYLSDGAEKAVEELCPDDCTTTVLDVDAANISTDLTSKLQTALQKDPEVNYVFVVWDSGVPYAQPVVAASGTKAKVIARDGIAASLQMVAEGDQQLTVATPPPGWIGWAAADDVFRAMLGGAPSGLTIPTRLVDKDNVGDGSDTDVSPNYTDYQSAFTKLWGVA